MLEYYVALQSRIAELRDREEGQTLAEYAVILAVIIVAAVATLTALSGGIKTTLGNVTRSL